MGKLEIKPFGGLNKILPEHRLVGKKMQKCRELLNYLSINGRIKTVGGSEKVNSSTVTGDIKWSEKIYFENDTDRFKMQFCVADGFIYRLNEETGTLNQVPILIDQTGQTVRSFTEKLNTESYPVSASIEIANTVTTYLVDGENIFKYDGNLSGEWRKLPTLTDLDGQTILPEYILEYQDRLWILPKKRNALLSSANLEPEVFDNSTDSVLIVCPTGKGGFPSALINHRGFLYMVHEDYFTPISGNSAATYGIPPGNVINGYGTRAPRSVVGLKTTFGFLNSEDNEYYLSGGTLDSTLKTPLSYEMGINKLINPVMAHKTVAHLDTVDDLLRISMVKTGESQLDYEVIYSINEEKWAGETSGFKISTYNQWNGAGDDGRLVTGRSDAGNLMFMNRGLNQDGSAMRHRFVFASYEFGDGIQDYIMQEVFVDARPFGRTTMPLSYYLDARLTTRGMEDVDMQGEITNLGLIEIGEQSIFLSRILPLIDRSRGRMIRFESDETTADVGREIYAIYVDFAPTQEDKSSKYIHGA